MPQSQAMQLLTSKETDCWHTPAEWIWRVRQVLGRIALDPASNPQANRTVQATHYYTQADNGLAQPWFGPLYANPPFNGQASKWTERFVVAYAEGKLKGGGIMLINSCHGYQWYERAWRACWSCLVRERIAFWTPDGTPGGGPAKKGSTFLYLGPNPGLFRAVFGPYGRVFPPAEE